MLRSFDQQVHARLLGITFVLILFSLKTQLRKLRSRLEQVPDQVLGVSCRCAEMLPCLHVVMLAHRHGHANMVMFFTLEC